jgi:hypothetical protein
MVLLPRCTLRTKMISDAAYVRTIFSIFRRVVLKSIKLQDILEMLFDALCDETCRLQDLDMEGCVLKEDAIRKLGCAINAARSLKGLGFSRTKLGLISATILASTLDPNNRLSTIGLPSMRYTAAAVLLPRIEKFKSLSSLNLSCDLSGAAGLALANLIENSRTLTHLNSFSGALDDAAAAHVARALGKNETLTSLLIYSKLPKAGSIALLKGIGQNRSLRTFVGASMMLSDPDLVATICHLLESTTTLKTCSLGYVSAGEPEFLRYCSALGACRSLRELSFDHIDYLTPEKARGVDVILKTTQNLESFHIHIRQGALSSFSAGIAMNRTVKELKLNSLALGVADWTFLASALSQNTTITTLALSTFIGLDDIVVGAQDAFDALAKHPCIRRLELSFLHHFDPASSKSFINMLQQSKSLQSLYFYTHVGVSHSPLVTYLISGLTDSSSVTQVDLLHLRMAESDWNRLHNFAQTRPGLILMPKKVELVK